MKLKMTAVFDSKIGAYRAPQFFKFTGEALRAWETVCNDPDTQFAKYPADFTLFEIGEFDEITGEFSAHAAKINLGLALSVKKQPETTLPLFPEPNKVRKQWKGALPPKEAIARLSNDYDFPKTSHEAAQ